MKFMKLISFIRNTWFNNKGNKIMMMSEAARAAYGTVCRGYPRPPRPSGMCSLHLITLRNGRLWRCGLLFCAAKHPLHASLPHPYTRPDCSTVSHVQKGLLPLLETGLCPRISEISLAIREFAMNFFFFLGAGIGVQQVYGRPKEVIKVWHDQRGTRRQDRLPSKWWDVHLLPTVFVIRRGNGDSNGMNAISRTYQIKQHITYRYWRNWVVNVPCGK